ncbi:MAG: endonuclease/exonuclease/phosphatase family protein [Bryobacteraceae bacterium]
MALRIVLYLIALFPVVVTLLPLSRTSHGWIRFWELPRLQIVALSVAAFAAVVHFGQGSPIDLAFLALLSGCFIYQTFKLLPYTFLYPRETLDIDFHDPRRSIRLYIANVEISNRRADRVLRSIARCDPDLICLLEPDAWWESQLRPLDEKYRHSVKHPLDNSFGILLYSRLPLIDPRLRYRVEQGIPSIDCGVRLWSGDRIRLYCLHPRPPRPWIDTFERDTELLLTGKEVRSSDRPTIVLGDLNDVAWSYTTRLFQKVSGMLDPRVGRGMYNTYHARIPFLRFSLDHIFHTPHFEFVTMKRLAGIGSDHFPIFAELSYRERRRRRLDPLWLAVEEESEEDSRIAGQPR